STSVSGPNGGNNPGNDTYLFGVGAGQDTIYDNDTTSGNVDTIRIIGKLPSEVTLGRSTSSTGAIYDLIIMINGTTDKLTVTNHFYGTSFKIEKVEFDDGTVWGTAELDAAPFLPTVAGSLYLTAGNDLIDLRNGVASNVFGPSGGNNLGNDTYLFGVGAGQDTIYDNDTTAGNVDTIRIIGELPSEVIVGRSNSGTGVGNDLVIAINGTADRLTVTNYFSGASSKIEKIEFDNGTVWGIAELDAKPLLPTTTGTQYLTSGSDMIDLRYGVATTVYGPGGSGTNAGNDTYLFGAGAGQDTIYDSDTTAGNIDTIRIIGKTASEVTFSRGLSGSILTNDLVLTINGTTDKLTVANHFADRSYQIEKVEFDNGTVWTAADIDMAAGAVYATSGNDLIDLRSAAATIVYGPDGSSNNPGNDTYLFGGGAGQDTINDNDPTAGNSDTIQLMGVLPTEVTLFRNAGIRGANEANDLVIAINGTTDRLTVTNHFAASSFKVENVAFENGTVWSAAELGAAQFLPTLTGNLYVTAGNDVIDLRSAAATSVSGPAGGNNAGNDTYLFGVGAGQDVIYDNDTTVGNSDTIKLTGLLPSEVTLNRNISSGNVANDLMITLNGTTDTLTVTNYFAASSFKVEKVVFDNGTVWTSAVMDGVQQYLPTKAGNLYVTSANDVIDLRNAVATNVYGPAGGNNPGNDIYLFGVGAGQDSINDTDTTAGNVDTIRIIGKLPSEVTLCRSVSGTSVTNDLQIMINGTSDTLTVKNHFSGSNYIVEKIEFDDGTVWDTAEFNLAVVLPTTAGTVYATAGNDIIDLRNGVATTILGPVNTTNLGNDVYLFGAGAGQDLIYDTDTTAGNIDTIKVIGKLPSEVTLGRSVSGSVVGNDLLITINGTTDKLTVTNYFSGSASKIEKIAFDDGTVWNTAELDAAPILPTVAGSLYVTSGNDVIDLRNPVASSVSGPGGGNNAGNDTYLFGAGAGQDTINDTDTTSGNVDTIKLIGKLPSEVTLARNVSGSVIGNDLLITINGTTDKLTVTNYFSGSASKIEKIAFDDGTVWNTAELDAAPILPTVAGSLYGTSGNDVIDLRNPVATSVSGPGGGNDTYLFGAGAGQDTINDTDTTSGNIDTIKMTGMLPSAVTLGRTGNNLTLSVNDTADQLIVQNYFSGSQYKIEKIQFDNGEAWGAFQLDNLNKNHAPVVVNPIPDQAATENLLLNFSVNPDTFSDLDVGDSFVYHASLANGSSLPAWIEFNPETRLFAGTPDNEATGVLSLRVTVTDLGGLSVSDAFELMVSNVNDGPIVLHPLADQSATEDFAFSMTMPANTFVDIDKDDFMQFSASMADGGALPSWLTFHAATRAFTGIPGNDDVGLIRIRVTATDSGNLTVADEFDLTVANTNDAPLVAHPITPREATEETPFVFAVPADTFMDLDSDDNLILTASLANGSALPAWLTFDPETQTLRGTPGNDDVGAMAVQMTATDGFGTTVSDTFQLNVVNTNDAPMLTRTIVNQTALEDTPFSFTLADATFIDIDAGDNLSYGATLANDNPLPSWLRFDATTCTFGGLPDNDQVGTLSIKVTATDADGLSVSGAFDLVTANTNDAPTLVDAIADQTVDKGSSFQFTLPEDLFADVDAGDTLTCNATLDDGSHLPAWLIYDAANRTFSGTPGDDDIGTVSIRVTAVDTSGVSVSDTFELMVINTNNAPVVATPITDRTATADTPFSFTVPVNVFADSDAGDTLTFTATRSDGSALPSWLVFDAADRTFRGTPGADSAGLLSLRVTATDPDGIGASDDFVLDIANHIAGSTGDDILTGTALRDVIEGLNGNDTLNGDVGADTLIGGLGDDLFLVDNIGEVVIENSGEGIDSVVSSVSHLLGANVENLILADVDAIDGIGNALDNRITGNAASNTLAGGAGNDTLNGGAGADTLIGGTGNDLYIVDDTSDITVELIGEGQDLVNSAVSYTLPANIEQLALTGTAPVDGVGNGLDNLLTGNPAANILAGGAGNDTLDGGAGADTLIGGQGNDTFFVDQIDDVVIEVVNEGQDTVRASVSFTLASHIENLSLLGAAAINAFGNDLDNVLVGNGAANTLDGGAGSDRLFGAAGDDTYIVDAVDDLVIESVGEGTDTVQSSVSYTLGANVENLTLLGAAAINGIGNDLNNILIGNVAVNTLSGGAGNDTLNGGGGTDTLMGRLGNDIYVVNDAGVVIIENVGEGTDTVLSTVSHALATNVENLTLLGTDAVDGVGNDLDNVLLGNGANNTLSGGAGNDTLDSGAGSDTLKGGLGNDLYIVDNPGDLVLENVGEGSDTVQSSASFILGANVENLVLTGTDPINGTGNNLNNLLTGNVASNILTGNNGNDTLNGGAGADTLIGHRGNDIYVVDNSGDVVVESVGEGTDTVQSSVSCTLSANVENLLLTGSDAIDGIGNNLNNVLVGNVAANLLTGGGGNDTLNGGTGADTLLGGLGNDAYYLDDAGDTIVELANEGEDIVNSVVSHTLSANVEQLTLTGTAVIDGTGNDLDNLITGNAAANTLTGGAGNDTINGGAGGDTLIGGLGNDTFTVDDNGDVVVEIAGEGMDGVIASVSFTLAESIENLTLSGTSPIDGTGNDLDNLLTGNAANNILNGGGGADTLLGGAGNDTYIVDNAADVVVESTKQGTDTIQSSVNCTLGANIENLILTGTAAINGTGNDLNNMLTGNVATNTLSGGKGNDTLNGGAGADTLIGLSGNDLYIVDNTRDVVIENVGEGTDTIYSSVSCTLGANVENLILTGSDAIDGTGNDLNNVLTGNGAVNTLSGGRGNDTLNGGEGADTLIGLLGNDLYIVDNSADVVIENFGEGADTIQSSVSYTLGANVENLTLTGSDAIDGTGNDINNVLIGNVAINTLSGGNGDDILDGGAGADTLTGGLGNDIYVVDNPGDVVIEIAGEGTDTVQSSLSCTLGEETENLTLLGTAAINGIGNALDNVLIGNAAINTLTGGAGNDLLNGGAGADILMGGTGDDIYTLDNTGDVVVELTNEGDDLVNSSVSTILATNIERLILTGTAQIDGTGNGLDNWLTGNQAANTLTGAAGNDILDGGAGADTLIGGLGNDVYTVDNVNDVVIEAVNEGIDTVSASVNCTLSSNIENLMLTGNKSIDATGNALDNVLTGNSAANVMIGGAGNDTLIGGNGGDTMIGGTDNDIYFVANQSDAVIEKAGEGIDLVQSSVNHTLADNVENLILTGTGNNSGTGNALNNQLIGSSGDNTLTGAGGNDILDGKEGADLLVGGAGNDTYLFGRGSGNDTVRENDATLKNMDVVQFLDGIAADQIWLQHSGNNLELSLIGSTDKLTIKSWYLGSQYHVEQFKTIDNRLLLDAQVENLVQVMAAFAPPSPGQTTLPQNYQNVLSPVIAANWH
ncbi:MAG: putative Ig domain-containing protein, partial [Magnetococcales bacterium]|nr:putative Ig domain-containing protein [Magnetococcales bacterium]